MERVPCVYLLASGFHGTLYTGVTSDLLGRTWQHREGVTAGFTRRYKVKRLVLFEVHERRKWKIELIERENPTWRDLAEDFGSESLIKKRWTPDQVRGDGRGA